MARDPELLAHLEWIGYLQPVGLVASPPALLAAQAHINRNIAPEHNRFLEWVEVIPSLDSNETVPGVSDLPGLLRDVFGWPQKDLYGGPEGAPIPEALEVALPEYGETLRPTYVLPEVEPGEGESPWMMLIQVLPSGMDPDALPGKDDHGWPATPHARFERLLRETGIPIGLLANGTSFRLVYAPKGETSGYVIFPIKAMSEVAGRPIFAALHMLLSSDRLFSLPKKQRLPAILAESRKYQVLVSTRLAEQVLSALYELLRGFQGADEQREGALLREVLSRDPDMVYNGLLTVLLRLIFILYAEDRGLVSSDAVYVNHYSVTGLFERLRSDAGRFPDTMDQRFGAWAHLLSLFRLVYDGGSHGGLRLPARHGYLFDPGRYGFLEGRSVGQAAEIGKQIDPPMVPDGVVFRVLQNLLVLDGERLSYRTLDVEQIGSVYETMMGFHLEVAAGRSIAVKPSKPHGAPTTVDLDELLKVPDERRPKWILDRTDQKLTGEALEAIKAARTPVGIVAALGRKVAREATPNIVPRGSMILQPSDERRKSGSHYTPRALTEPIVRKALEPILKRLGANPTPAQILDLKVCDPAMGSGAFLVEACRQLGDVLVEAWRRRAEKPPVPADEDEFLYARRLIARRCLYGVDRNSVATDLAKLSLWLSTLAKDHPFTFLDHAFGTGDSLVGLTEEQIAGFHWKPEKQISFIHLLIEKRLKTAKEKREAIRGAGEDVDESAFRSLLVDADSTLDDVRLIGDLAASAFFKGENDRKRNEVVQQLGTEVQEWLEKDSGSDLLRARVSEMRSGARPMVPFHWEIEFPEVFGRETPGFDVIVGNPPFMGGSKVSSTLGPAYLDWILTLHEGSHGNGDLVAQFFRRAFQLVRYSGAFGLIATNTIAQGDTRVTGLRWILQHGGEIFEAQKRLRWPGLAAVVVSVLHIIKGTFPGPKRLDDHNVDVITAFLFHRGGHDDPARLQSNRRQSFAGVKIYGQGFTFDDTDRKGVASAIAEMERLIRKDTRNDERISRYIGGEEVNDSPSHAHHRYVINFADYPLKRELMDFSWGSGNERQRLESLRKGIVPLDYPWPVATDWPDLLSIVEERVKPSRLNDNRELYRRYWWQYGEKRRDLYDTIRGMERVLVTNCGATPHLSFVFQPSNMVFAHSLAVFPFSTDAAFCALQTRPHEIWARFFGSSMKDDLRYTPSDCFETFPFPKGFKSNSSLEEAGRAYYEYRAALMVKNDEGLTKTYNRFHDPEERSSEIQMLRELHAAMDRAVFDAYGWTDLTATCEFLLDYEDEEDDEEGGGRRRKKPWRYRWPDASRDEVLARLLALNRERAEQEQLTGTAAEGNGKKGNRGLGRKRDPQHSGSLF